MLKGIPDKTGFYWVRWFDPSWMNFPITELAHFHPNHGFKFYSDGEDWDLDKVKATDFEYRFIEPPNEHTVGGFNA